LAADLLEELEPEIESITLIPSDDGRFEVEVNGDLVYSKLKTERHPKPGEIMDLVKAKLPNSGE
jgi:selenoprotein W-related protein